MTRPELHPPEATPDRDCVYLDVRDGQLTVTQTTGRTLALAVNGEWVMVSDQERTTIELSAAVER